MELSTAAKPEEILDMMTQASSGLMKCIGDIDTGGAGSSASGSEVEVNTNMITTENKSKRDSIERE